MTPDVRFTTFLFLYNYSTAFFRRSIQEPAILQGMNHKEEGWYSTTCDNMQGLKSYSRHLRAFSKESM